MSVTSRAQREPLVAPGEIEHHVADLTFTASADCTLAQVQETLARNDQWLPIDGTPAATLGELVQKNSTGPLRIGYGGWRDLLLGAQVRTRGGAFVTAGGRTMKNVAGYDLTKFAIGQYGLFADVITITVRTVKRPAGVIRATFAPSSTLVGELLPTAARPQYAMLTADALTCGYFGNETTLAFYREAVAKLCPTSMEDDSVEGDTRFRAERWLPERSDTRFRASVPPMKVSEFVRSASLSGWAADACFGIVVGRVERERMSEVRSIAQSVGGTVAFDDPADIESFFGAQRPTFGLLQRLRTAFNE